MSERRYKLQINTDAEIEVLSNSGSSRICRMVGVDGWVFTVPEHWLTEIPPPIPMEPEPGAYLIGDAVAQRPEHVHDEIRWLVAGGSDWYSWADALKECDSEHIVPLVAKPAAVDLPWTLLVNLDDEMAKVYNAGDTVWVKVSGRVCTLEPGQAREMGWALLSAADRAEAGE